MKIKNIILLSISFLIMIAIISKLLSDANWYNKNDFGALLEAFESGRFRQGMKLEMQGVRIPKDKYAVYHTEDSAGHGMGQEIYNINDENGILILYYDGSEIFAACHIISNRNNIYDSPIKWYFCDYDIMDKYLRATVAGRHKIQ